MTKFLTQEQCKRFTKTGSVRLVLFTALATGIAYFALSHVKHPPSSKLVLSAHLQHHHDHLDRLDKVFVQINIINQNVNNLKKTMILHELEELKQ